jgi:Fe-S-cluster containining protein
MHNLHDEVFNCTDCLKCANCCTTTGPLFTYKDINRIAKHLKLKPSVFTNKYLKIDEDNDFVLKQVPCAFLSEDNYCSIYNVRPKACQEFPHTDRIKQHQILKLTEKNVSVCPAVYEIVEKLKKIYL